ncbi:MULTISPECIES: helix-turn-helix domain-containing protein [unclassified Paenibacillus]|uniref:response regulator transcription factor n=1 Tax=unclassified Paenibacillus TaxID=185978 RepID=UPI00277DD37F|nr:MULTISPECIES: helix-turn-helix domain-containing protein [unclassified Paenibacillus]MDQ0897698.1 two-component system response regulator YesN [Paenibacillus sp. V4I7]MDQ0916310.1 two-component system response regulator YesN [Paenibacillus sp. V4I5]
MKALIVDDENNVRKIIRFLGKWEQHGITEVLEARNGLEAKVLIDQECPEIIMTDVKMPKNNGIELIEWLDANSYPGKVIMISGFDDYSFMRKAFKHGCFDYLMKPIENEMLNETLAGAVKAWKNGEEERRNMESGFYEEVKMFRLNREITSASNGELFDSDEIALSLPQADAYDLTMMYFYHAHHSDPYLQLLTDELVIREWGNAFALQNDPNVCVILSVHGRFFPIEEWITQHFDIPVRLVSSPPIESLEELPQSFQYAKRAMAEQNFRAIHRLADLDDAKRMHDIVAFVNEYYMEELSLDKLSSRFFLSREHISRRFKQEIGMTLSSYVIQLRINQAKRWLSETDEKMYSIALKLGYQDENYFSRLFKKNVGMTPLEYRNAEENIKRGKS